MLASSLIGYEIGGPCSWFSSRAKTQHEKQQRKARRSMQAPKKSEADAVAEARCRHEAEPKAADEAARKARKESEVNAKREAEIARRQAETEAHAAAVSKAHLSFGEPDAVIKSGGSDGNDEAQVSERSEDPRKFECPIR
jgi:hypothetical protein